MKSLKVISSILLSLLLIFVCAIFWKKCVSKNLSPRQVKNVVKADREQVEAIRNAKEVDSTIHSNIGGVQHATKIVAVGTSAQIKKYYKPEIKKRAEELGIKENNISGTNDFKATIHDSFKIKGEEDVIKGGYRFPIKRSCTNGYIEVSHNLDSAEVVQNTVIHFKGTIYWKKHRKANDLLNFRIRKFFRGITTTRQDISTDCDNVKIDSISSLQIIKGY